jgi:hypothetical protein
MMRNKNIFLRKENEFSVNHCGGLPVFAHVTDYVSGNVYYTLDFIEPVGYKDWYWYYGYYNQKSGTYIKPLEEFLERFEPDYWNKFAQYV